MGIIEFNKSKPRRSSVCGLPLDQATGAGRLLNKMERDIQADLNGKRELTRIELELISAFAGAATTLRYLNAQVALGETSEIDLAGFSTIASTMLRIGSNLGLRPRKVQNKQTFGALLSADYDRQQIEDRDRDQQRREELERNQRAACAPADDNEVA